MQYIANIEASVCLCVLYATYKSIEALNSRYDWTKACTHEYI